MSMRTALAADLSGLFGYEMTETVEINLNGQYKQYTVIVDDLALETQLNFGGGEDVGMRKVHFKTTDLPSIQDGTTIFILEPTNIANQTTRVPKVVMSSLISADGSELIVTVKGK